MGRAAGLFAPRLSDPERPAGERLAATQAAVLGGAALPATPEEGPDPVAAVVGELLRQTVRRGGFFDDWADSLEPAADRLAPAVAAAAAGERTPEAAAASAYLARWARPSPRRVHDWLLDPSPWQRDEFRRMAAGSRKANAGRYRTLAARVAADPTAASEADRRRAALAAALLAESGEADLLPACLARSPEPALRVTLVSELADGAASDADLAAWANEAAGRGDPAAEEGFLQALAGRPRPGAAVVGQVASRFQMAGDPGVHSSAAVCLANWGAEAGRSPRLDRPAAGDGRLWRVNAEGMTLVRPPVKAALGYEIEAAACEVTVDQIRRFDPGHYINYDTSPTPDCPANVVTFADAVGYCRWLTLRCGVSEEDQFYPAGVAAEAVSGADRRRLRTRGGYRLPTAEEYALLARAGVRTPFEGGRTDRRMRDLTWVRENSDGRARPVISGRPNAFGIFHAAGNITEWCGDRGPGEQRVIAFGSHRTASDLTRLDDILESTHPGTEWNQLGFRVVRTAAPPVGRPDA